MRRSATLLATARPKTHADMSSSSPESSQELQYPPARVDQSFVGLDLNTLIMRSNAQITHEANPLEESTYEVLPASDSLYDTSDDEGHTASVSSTTPDDVSNFDDDEDDDDDFQQGYINEPTPEVDPAAPAEPHDDYTLSSGHDSTLTEIPSMDGSESSCVIQLQEASAEHTNMDARAVIKEFRKDQVSDVVLSRYGRSHMRLSVQATLSERHLAVPVGRPFNVLYVGKMDESWIQTDIESRVAAALNKSPGPSRSIMIRGQMETCGPEMVPWYCSAMELHEEAGKKTGVTVTLLHHETKLTVGTENMQHNTESSRMPDLVVFWYPHPNVTALEVDDYYVASEAFGRHHVPCLHIAADRRFHLHQKGFTDESLRVCVEGRDNHESEFEQQETIPIDLFTFMNLDPAQLNRHLAALGPRIVAASPSSLAAPAKPGLFSNIMNRAMTSKKQDSSDFSSPMSPNTKKLLSAFAALVLMVALYVGAAIMPQPYYKVNDSNVGSVIPSILFDAHHSVSSAVSAATTSTTQPAVSLAPPPSVKTTSWDLTVVPTPQQPSQRKNEPKASEKVAGFEIQTTGEHQFVLSPSKDFTSRKRKPQLQIQVYQDAKTIPIQYVRTIEGAYVVDLEQQYPMGSFNVSIATHSKPLMQQSFAITMGRKRSRLARLVDDVKNDIVTIQQEIQELSSSFSQRLSDEFATIEDNAGVWKGKVDHSKREVANHLQKARNEAKRRVAAGVELLGSVPGTTWMGLRKVTAPVRTSRASLRARNNALRIRCAFEQSVGLSSRGDKEKKTRACKKIGW